MAATLELPELSFGPIAAETAPPAADAGSKKKAKAAESKAEAPAEPKGKKGKARPEMTVPQVRTIAHRDRVEEIWSDLRLETNNGFYAVIDKGAVKDKGVIAYADMMGKTVECRVPFENIKGIMRRQWVSDMQATEPLILASDYMLYNESPVAFGWITEAQFNTLDVMFGPRIARTYTYHDLADSKRGYTFAHQDFPSLEEQEEYRLASLRSIQRKKEVEPEKEEPKEPAQ